MKILKTELSFTSLTKRYETDMIVIHHTGCNDIDASAEQIHSWHRGQGWAGIGYHYVIRKNGTIETGRPEDCVGSHAYGENSHTIGIHLSGDFEQAQPTNEQIEACAELLADLCKGYGIEINRKNIVGHGELMATDCPGKNLYEKLELIVGKANWYYERYYQHGLQPPDVSERYIDIQSDFPLHDYDLKKIESIFKTSAHPLDDVKEIYGSVVLEKNVLHIGNFSNHTYHIKY